MMPSAPKPEKALEDMTIEELNSSIEQLGREIDGLTERLRKQREFEEPSRSRGDELPDKDTATDEGVRQPKMRRGKGVQKEVIGKDIEFEITRKTQEKVRRIFRRDEILRRQTGEEE